MNTEEPHHHSSIHNFDLLRAGRSYQGVEAESSSYSRVRSRTNSLVSTHIRSLPKNCTQRPADLIENTSTAFRIPYRTITNSPQRVNIRGRERQSRSRWRKLKPRLPNQISIETDYLLSLRF